MKPFSYMDSGMICVQLNFSEMTLILDGSTRCETAWLTLKCYYDIAPEVNSNKDKQSFDI